MNPAVSVYSIPSEAAFLQTLVEWIVATYGEDLPAARVFLPNRRACRSFREALLASGGGKPMLLPRIQPIGDMENDALPADLFAHGKFHEIPPAISPERRLLLLTRLVLQFEEKRGGQLTQAVQLAR